MSVATVGCASFPEEEKMYVSLDGAWLLQQAFVLGYRFTDNGSDLWTSRFNAFKAGRGDYVARMCAVMRHALHAMPAPRGPIVVLGVPGSGVTQLAEGPVRQLAQTVADVWGGTVDREMVQKNIHAPLHTRFSTSDRDELLDQAQYRVTHYHTGDVLYVLVDDLVTRGATMQRIVNAIRAQTSDARFMAIAAGKTERQQYWDERGEPISNDHATVYEAVWNAPITG
jgi:hypothetical protein